jgi:AraC-like DNA-binding protein
MLKGTYFMLERTRMTFDPFSDLIELADAQCSLSGAVLAQGEWATDVPSPKSLKVFVMKGACWFTVLHQDPVRLEPGDVIVIKAGNSYLMESRPGTPLGGSIEFAKDDAIGMEAYNSPACLAFACFVSLDAERAHLLLDSLPASIIVRGAAPEAAGLRSLYDQLMQEVRANAVGSRLAIASLTQLIFLHVLRWQLAQGTEALPLSDRGWLGALRDKNIAAALKLLHSQPARTWTLEELARSASMSRTTFAKRFRGSVGSTPLNYLRDLRMGMAARSLHDPRQSIADIAYSLGYASESAFSSAFKKRMKVGPARYRSELGGGHAGQPPFSAPH